MKQTIGLLIALYVAMSAVPPQATAAIATLTGDAYTSATAAATNYGKATSLVIKGLPAGSAISTVFVQFDLASLPPGTTGADVAQATLTVSVNTVSMAGAFDVFRVTSAWTEAGIKAFVSPTLGATPEVSGVPVAVSDKHEFKTIDVTQLVKDWLDNVLPNDGIALVPNTAGVSAKFDSKENTTTCHAPQLDIELGAVTDFNGNLSGAVPLANGGTGASTAAGGRNNLGAAAKGSNSDITSLSGLTTPLAVTEGGTGAGTAAGARSNLAAAASGANSDITSLSGITGNIDLPASTAAAGNITKAGARFIHTFGPGNNTFIGLNSGNFSTTGGSSTAVGAQALGSNTSGYENTAIGSLSLLANTTGADNVAVGAFTLAANTTGFWNVAVGHSALTSNTTGANDTALGAEALAANTTGNTNTALGWWALKSNTTGIDNTAVGSNVLVSNTTAASNTAVGSGTLTLNTAGSSNTALGFAALNVNTSGNDNTGLGVVALTANTTGSRNAAVGRYALQHNTTGNDNTGLGLSALDANTTASANTAVGEGASQLNTTGANNSAFGQAALSLNTGSNNVGIGQGAGRLLTTGNNNIDIGNQGVAAESNTIRIGASGTQTAAFVAGIRGVTTGVANGITVLIDSNGQLGTISSSRRFKTDIHDMANASNTLMRLRPVTFRYKPDIDPSGTRQYGLIAEEVEQVMPDLVAYDKDGKIETVKYHLLAALLLNEVQKQQREIDTERQHVTEQAHALKAQAQQIEILTAQARQASAQVQQMDALTARLAQLESAISTRPQAPAVETGYRKGAGL